MKGYHEPLGTLNLRPIAPIRADITDSGIADLLDLMRVGDRVRFATGDVVERVTKNVYRINKEREVLTFFEMYVRLTKV